MTEIIPSSSVPEENAGKRSGLARQRWIIAGCIVGVILVLALLVWAVFALSSHPAAAARHLHHIYGSREPIDRRGFGGVDHPVGQLDQFAAK